MQSIILKDSCSLFQIIILSILVTGCSCEHVDRVKKKKNTPISNDFKLDHSQAKKDLKFFTRKPHPFGSLQQQKVKKYLGARIGQMGIGVEFQDFSSKVPIRDVSTNSLSTSTFGGTNVIAFKKESRKDCALLIGSHYDTKYHPSQKFVGANDSGSSSILLKQLIRFLHLQDRKCDFIGVWFDGEEPQLANWDDGEKFHPLKLKDNTYGSRNFVKSMTNCKANKNKKCITIGKTEKRIIGLILIDMVGDKNLKISDDVYSTLSYRNELKKILKRRNLSNLLGKKRNILDDHIPFLKAGINAIDIIDFENLGYWHTLNDTTDKISMQSIDTIGKITADLASTLNP